MRILHFLDPVYTRANDSGFVANPECFDIGFVLRTKEQESDTTSSPIDYESETFESGKVCRIFVSEKV